MNQCYRLMIPIILTLVIIMVPSNTFAVINNNNDSVNHTKSITLQNISNSIKGSGKSLFW